MKIDGFKVDGIANIEHANLRTGELCALIAPNGYGKSNVLRAIEFGIRFLTADDAERRQMLNGRWMSINTAIYGGYEPDELPTALPRDICKRYISTDRPPRQGLTQKTFRPDLPGPAPNCLHTADREGKRLCGALLFRDSGVCLQRTERAGRMPCR